MKLIPVDSKINTHLLALYHLLEERPAYANISHREMPTWEQHVEFVERRPYKDWQLVCDANGMIVGAVYLTDANEIGVGILKAFQRLGYGRYAVREMVRRYPTKRLLANIAPGNKASRRMFEELGFAHIQDTLCMEAGE